MRNSTRLPFNAGMSSNAKASKPQKCSFTDRYRRVRCNQTATTATTAATCAKQVRTVLETGTRAIASISTGIQCWYEWERERERERAYAMTYCVWLIGRIVIKDKPALDLTVVLVKAGVLQTGVGDVRSRAFRFVVHSRTRCFITLVSVELLSDTTSSNDQHATHGAHEQQQEEATRRWYHYVEYRYESWVEYQSATPHCRRNLAPLAIQLSKLEHEAGNKAVVWQFQAQPSFDSFMTTRSNKPSAIEPQQLRKHVKEFLLCASDATTTSKQV
jgi:hypothetical protein